LAWAQDAENKEFLIAGTVAVLDNGVDDDVTRADRAPQTCSGLCPADPGMVPQRVYGIFDGLEAPGGQMAGACLRLPSLSFVEVRHGAPGETKAPHGVGNYLG
jgi:hypothetical protein